MSKHPRISIPLDIADLRVLQTEITKDGKRILTVERTLTSMTCRRCGRTITDRHDLDEPRLLRHLPILGRVVSRCIRFTRFRCPVCDDHPTTPQTLEWYDPNTLHPKAYERHRVVPLVKSTRTDVDATEDVTVDAVLGILNRWIATTVDWDALEAFATLGIDAIALLNGHRDVVAVISAPTEHGDLYVLVVLPDRWQATIVAWRTTMPAAIQAHITTVCTDMGDGDITAVQEVLGHATIVIDCFPGARHSRDAVATLCKQELRRLTQDVPKDIAAALKRTL